MPARRIVAPKARAQVIAHHTDDIQAADRLTDALAAEAARIASRTSDRFRTTVDLAVGDNRINHGLGRSPLGASVSPTAVDATFAWAMTSRDERQVVITVAGVAQSKAGIELW